MRQISMPPGGFEPRISAGERPQTYALDNAATGIGITRFNIHKSYVLPTQSFVGISEQTAIISLYSINRLVFITETKCVYCAVRTGNIHICHQFNNQQFYVLPTRCIYVFCVDLRTNSDYFPIQH